jgi:hypothetical protein
MMPVHYQDTQAEIPKRAAVHPLLACCGGLDSNEPEQAGERYVGGRALSNAQRVILVDRLIDLQLAAIDAGWSLRGSTRG